jgi:hypothetical protein
MQDMVKKGRQVSGVSARLTADLVYEMRLLAGDLSTYEIARQYQVSQTTAQRVLSGTTWRQVATVI